MVIKLEKRVGGRGLRIGYLDTCLLASLARVAEELKPSIRHLVVTLPFSLFLLYLSSCVLAC